jgi:hypothetical protein
MRPALWGEWEDPVVEGLNRLGWKGLVGWVWLVERMQ